MSVKKQQSIATSGSSSLLDLPLEVRELIYEFCYLKPHLLSSREPFDRPQAGTVSKPSTRKRRRKNQATKRLMQQKIVTKCYLPQSHLSLGSVCRQIRNEFFPVFARHHVFSISDPLTFANGYLSYKPPHRYSNIQHLAIRWQASVSKCKCETYAANSCPNHPARCEPVSRDAQTLVNMVDTYPELFSNLQSINLSVMPVPFMSHIGKSATYLFKYAVLLVQKMDRTRRRDMSSLNEQKYVLAIPSAHPSRLGAEVAIFAVTDEVWDLLVDGRPLHEKQEISEEGWFLSCVNNTVEWCNINAFTTAVKNGTLYHDIEEGSHGDTAKLDPPTCPLKQARELHHRTWKAVFREAEPSECWRTAMIELDIWQGHRRTKKQDSSPFDFWLDD